VGGPTFPVLKNPANRHKAVTCDFEQWNYAFTNTFPEERARALFERYAIPVSGHILFESALADLIPGHGGTYVDDHDDDRAPLLFVSGSEDTITPSDDDDPSHEPDGRLTGDGTGALARCAHGAGGPNRRRSSASAISAGPVRGRAFTTSTRSGSFRRVSPSPRSHRFSSVSTGRAPSGVRTTTAHTSPPCTASGRPITATSARTGLRASIIAADGAGLTTSRPGPPRAPRRRLRCPRGPSTPAALR
jgi:hypothetical protein